MTEQMKTPLQRLAELMDAEYPDPAPPKQWVQHDFYLYETLSEAEFDHLRHELAEGEVKT